MGLCDGGGIRRVSYILAVLGGVVFVGLNGVCWVGWCLLGKCV